MRARYNKPSTGRFINEDPIIDGRNFNYYGNKKPTKYVDDSGVKSAAVLYVLSIALSTMIFTLISYAVATHILESRNPGYRGGRLFGVAALAVVGTSLTLAAGFTLGNKGKPMADVDVGSLTRAARRALRQSQVVKSVGRAAGIGMLMGVLLGVTNAVYEIDASDYFLKSGT